MDKGSNTEKNSNIGWYAVPLTLVAGIGIGIGAAVVIFTTFPQHKDTTRQDKQQEITSADYSILKYGAEAYPEVLPQMQEYISKNGKITEADKNNIYALIENSKRNYWKEQIAQLKVEPTARRQQ